MFFQDINKGVSVIVCCYNSGKRLSPTLTHLFEQVVKEGVDWEILVINNASTDNTAKVAWNLYEESNSKIKFRVIDEPKPGLNNARFAGLRESLYEYMIWVDDDNWLQADYISLAYSIMEDNPQIGVLGGIGEPVLEVEAPSWFEKYKLTYATGKQANNTGEILDYGFLYGAGAVIRKSAWIEVIQGGFKTILTDRKGTALLCGGDVEIENAIRLTKYKLWYDERLMFRHYIPKERLTWDYLMRSTKGSGESDVSAAVFYFIFRHPDLNFLRFRYLYYKRMIWLLLQIFKVPKSFYNFVFNRYDSSDWIVIEVNRNLANLRSSFENRKSAYWAFYNIMRLKRTLKYS